MTDENKDQRIVVLMTPTELEAIDAWSFANRIRSRGEAIRRLCQLGLTYRAENEAIRSQASKVMESIKSISFTMDEELPSYPSDEHFDQVLALVDASAELVGDIRKLEAAARFLADGGKPTAIDHGDNLRQLLSDTRAKREAASAEIRGK